MSNDTLNHHARCVLERAAQTILDRAESHYRAGDHKMQDECLRCASVIRDLKPERATEAGTTASPAAAAAGATMPMLEYFLTRSKGLVEAKPGDGYWYKKSDVIAALAARAEEARREADEAYDGDIAQLKAKLAGADAMLGVALKERDALLAQRTAGAVPQIEYRYAGGTHWCDLGPAEHMKPDFEGVYRLKAGQFPTWQGDAQRTAGGEAVALPVEIMWKIHGVVRDARCLALAHVIADAIANQRRVAEAAAQADDWRDKLRWSKANTDYHGYIAFTPGHLEHFVSMLIGEWKPKQSAAAPTAQPTLPKVVLELPDGDTRVAKVWWKEMRGNELHVRITVDMAAQPTPELDPKDLRIDTYSPMPRPQWATNTDRGISITHVPTGLTVREHEDRSQHRNKAVALQKLRELVAAQPTLPDDERRPTHDQVEQYIHDADAELGPECESDWVEWCRATLRAALRQPGALPDAAEDAARYRWLRYGDNDEVVLQRGPVDPSYVYLPRNEKLDAAIDAAIDAARAIAAKQAGEVK